MTSDRGLKDTKIKKQFLVTLRVLMNAEQKISEQKNAELMFANLSRIRKLKFRFFF